MKSFTAITSLFAGLTAALPQATPVPGSYENIDISDFSVRKTSGEPTTIQSVYFKINGTDATDLVCSVSDPAYPSKVITCGESKYRFAIAPAAVEPYEFELSLYHELGPAYVFHSLIPLLVSKRLIAAFHL